MNVYDVLHSRITCYNMFRYVSSHLMVCWFDRLKIYRPAKWTIIVTATVSFIYILLNYSNSFTLNYVSLADGDYRRKKNKKKLIRHIPFQVREVKLKKNYITFVVLN